MARAERQPGRRKPRTTGGTKAGNQNGPVQRQDRYAERDEHGGAHADGEYETYQVLVECDGEAQQQAIYERLTAEGLHCRLLTL